MKNPHFYIQMIIHILTIIYFGMLLEKDFNEQNHIFGLILIFLIYYEMFVMLAIFNTFTTLVGILNKIIIKMIPLFAIMLYGYMMIVVCMVKLNLGKMVEHFKDGYYWLFLGGIDGDAFAERYSMIPVIIGSLFVSIIMINVMIAFLSNLYSRLEDQQKIVSLELKAHLILDVEIIIRFFKYKMTGISSLKIKLEKLKKEALSESVIINLQKVNYQLLNK